MVFDVAIVTALSLLAVFLNAYAAGVSDRASERRAELETGWEDLIARTLGATPE